MTEPSPVSPPDVLVRDSGTAKGRGVYAARGFVVGELVEACPVVPLSGTFASIPEPIRKLLFNWRVLSGDAHEHCLALGYGSLYNHDNPANMRYEADLARRELRYIAARAIEAGEELTVNYNAAGGGHASDEDTWFERMQVVRV